MIKQPTIVLIFKGIHKKEHYWEDPDSDYGTEHVSLTGTWKIWKETVKGLKAAIKRYDEIMNRNADNPPYDEYRFVAAYYKKDREVIGERTLSGGYE